MKRVAALLTVGFLAIGGLNYAQDVDPVADSIEQQRIADSIAAAEQAAADQAAADEAAAAKEAEDKDKVKENETTDAKVSIVSKIKGFYIDGGPIYMFPLLLCLILGLALIIERIIYLNLATINRKKFEDRIDEALAAGPKGVETAKEIARNERGPIASIYYQGLDRTDEGLEAVEKSITAYGGVQMGNLEKGVSWIGLFIALAPMLGFMGTVMGMIQAFKQIAESGGVKPDEIAADIQVALITTVSGLIVAIILQLFHNYIVSKIDGMVNDMEDSSITLIDLLIKNKAAK